MCYVVARVYSLEQQNARWAHVGLCRVCFCWITFKETTTSAVKMDESVDDGDVSPHILRVMKNCKILEMLTALASSVQVLIDERSKPKPFGIL